MAGPANPHLHPHNPTSHPDHTHDHMHAHDGRSEMECCAHHEIQIERHIVLYLVGAVLLISSHLANWLNLTDPQVAQIPAAIGAILLSIPLLWAAWTEVSRMRPSSSTLAGIAILAALATGEYATAGWLAFILLVAGQIVRRTASGAQRAIAALVRLTPDTARVVENGVEREARLSQVTVGQVVRVFPGENLPVDGKIVSGRSTLNQASLTGEAAPVEVQPGDPVYAGTTNLTGAIDLEVTRVGGDTTIGKVTQLIREAEQARSPRQLLIEQVAQFFVPVALSVAGIVLFMMSQSEHAAIRDNAVSTAVTVLVVTCPSALLLASPSAMVAAFAAAARLGVMIKQTSYLEAAANVNTVVLDKTGTITTGSFEVSRLAPADGVDGAELLKSAATAEQSSNHPLAQSILKTSRAARVQPDAVEQMEEFHGRGVKATAASGTYHVGRAKWLLEVNPAARAAIEAVEAKIEGMTGVHVMRDGRYLGAVGLDDKIRPNTRGVIDRLRELGIKHIAVFTGDRLGVAKRVGVAVGADAVEAECLPEEKHEQIRQLVKQGYRVMMVGDGINDGPSLAAADVGVAMGLGGSDIAANSAGVALMKDELSRIPLLIELARRTRVVVGQNIAASILIAVIGLTLAATGTLSAAGGAGLALAALYHFVGDVFVIGNSFRLVRFGEAVAMAEAEHEGEEHIRRREASLRGLAAQPA